MTELIDRAEHAETEAKRARARREAANLAALLWKRRDRLPGKAYPLAPYQRLLETLTVLRADERRRWWGASPDDREAAALFQGFARLMPLLALSQMSAGATRPRLSGAAYDALTVAEQTLLSDIGAWIDASVPEVGETAPPAVHFVFEETDPSADHARQLTDSELPASSAGDMGAREDTRSAPNAKGPIDEASLAEEPEPTISPGTFREAAVRCIDDLLLHLTRVRASLAVPSPRT